MNIQKVRGFAKANGVNSTRMSEGEIIRAVHEVPFGVLLETARKYGVILREG